LKWIGFTVSEKVNPGEPGGTKPRVRLPGTGFGQRITLADVNSLERTAGLPKKQSCLLKKLLFTLAGDSGAFLKTQPAAFFGSRLFL
jgi:hypothetical protein